MKNAIRHAAKVLFMSLAFAFLSIGATSLAENNVKFLDKDLILQLNRGIYEVVTPKLESSKIKYDRPLPFDTLDFAERNEKYHSIGTAFFINERQLMTAEHVFHLMYFSLQQKFFVRDSSGNVYPVGRIHQYSTVRDMLVFDLEQYPKQVVPLKFNRQAEVGDTVFTAGNAQGEGIAYRAGQVASFTSEAEYGKWKNIRFSSPASPGNSGGPLLNLAGEVVGLVVRKNQSENYNIAVPINEFDQLDGKADLQLRNLRFDIKGAEESIVRDWVFSLPLPATVDEFAERAQDALHAFYKNLSNELTERVKEKNFPKGERFRHYLRNQPIFTGFASLSPDSSFNAWNLVGYSMEKMSISAEQNVFQGGSLHFNMQALVERPPKTSLKEFQESPKSVLDTLLKAIPYYRPFGVERIRIVSFGEPESSTIWQDNLGRTWTSSFWYGEHDNYFVSSHCLPHPKGALCNVDVKPAELLKLGYFDAIKEGIDEISVGYEGEFDDWIEYFALDEACLPAFFRKAEMSREGGRLILKLKDFKLDFSSPKIGGKSVLHLHMGYANEQLLAEELVRLELFPQKGSMSHYRIQPLWEPGPFDSESYVASWEEGMKSIGEFSGRPFSKGEQIVMQKIVPETKKTVALPGGESIEKAFVVGCIYRAAEEDDTGQDCGQFFRSIEFF